MTVYQKLFNALCNNGMFDKDAEEIMQMVMSSEANKPMANRWDDLADDYPPTLLEALWMSTCDFAVEWIDQNRPLAWNRALFVV